MDGIILLGVFLLTFVSLVYIQRLYLQKKVAIEKSASFSLIFPVIVGLVLFQILSAFSFEWLFGIYPIVLGCLGLVFIQLQKKYTYWYVLIVTFLSVWCLPLQMNVFGGYLPIVLDRACTAILWSFFVHIYCSLGQSFQLISLQTNVFCFVLMIFPAYYLSRLGADEAVRLIGNDASVILASFWAFVFFVRFNSHFVLGQSAVLLLGYLIGYLLILMACFGLNVGAFILTFYCVFEYIYFKINQHIHLKKNLPMDYPFFFLKALLRAKSPRRFSFSFFSILLMQGLFCLFLSKSFLLCLLLSIFLVFYLVLSFLVPRVSYRTIFTDAILATKTLTDAVKTEYKKVKKD